MEKEDAEEMAAKFREKMMAGQGGETAEALEVEATAETAETSEAQTNASTNAFEAADLVGTWQSPCFPSPQGDGSFNQLTFKMTESEWDLDYVAHGDEGPLGAGRGQ